MRKVKLEDIAEIFSGLSYRRYLDNDGDEFKVIVQRSIKKDGNCGDFENARLKNNIKERYFSQKNDVLMKMPYPNEVVCIKQDGLIISEKIAIIRLKKGYDPDFIAHMLSNVHIERQLYQINGREKIHHISLNQIKQLELLVIDLDLQKKYSNLLNKLDEKIKEDLKQVDNDRNFKQAIINDLWVHYEIK